MTTNDVYERLGVLEKLVQHLYANTGIPMPDMQTLARSAVSSQVQQLLASGNKIAAIKADRDAVHRITLTAADRSRGGLHGLGFQHRTGVPEEARLGQAVL